MPTDTVPDRKPPPPLRPPGPERTLPAADRRERLT
jgi:hypothetical protein